MAHYYKLPGDFYCWGQDRGGTLIPLISQVFIKLFNCSALIAVSLSNYLILILGYVGLSSLIKSRFYKIVFAIIWFLPFQRFIDILRFPIGVEYSLLGLSIFLICKLEDSYNSKWYVKHVLLTLIALILILSVWVSDLAIVSIATLLIVLFIFHFFKTKQILINKTISVYILFGITCCFIFIRYAKSFATNRVESYLSVNGVHEIERALFIITNSFKEILVFNTNEIFVSIYTYLAILFILSFLFILLKKKFVLHFLSNKWFVFFLTDFVLIFIVFLLSTWVLLNEMGRWYFVASYISLSLAIILALDNPEIKHETKFLRWGILFISLFGAISPIYTMKFTRPKSLKPKVEVVGEFKQLGEIGIIGEFWNSYITSSPDPALIKATPHDKSDVRNYRIVDMVFERDNIYVIKDMWMDTFPDTLEQFGYVLSKEGNQFRLGNCEVSRYNKIKLHKSFPITKLKYSGLHTIVDDSGEATALFLPGTCNSCKQRYIINGPGIPIGVGEFSVSFRIKVSNFRNSNPIALLDVVAEQGAKKLAETKIDSHNFPSDEYSDIVLNFKTPVRYNHLEFRVYYYGNADLFFNQIVLKEK